MKIGYEAKRVYHNKTGLGNYSRDLIRILANFYPNNEYYLYNPKHCKEKLFSYTSDAIIEKLPSSPFFKKFYNLWRQKGIISDLKKDKIEIFHGLSGEIPSGLKKYNIKSIVTIHDLIFVRYPKLYSFFDRKIHFYKFKKSAQNADLVIAISEQTKKDIVSFLKIPSHKIKVIYQTCQDVFKREYSLNEKEAIKNKYNLPDKFLLNVGTIEERKNTLAIIKAIKDLDTPLVLIGKETAYCDELRNFIEDYNMTERVIFFKVGNSKELAVIYQLSTIFIYPSIFEGFGIPIIEALYSKTPVITNIEGVFPEAGGPNSIYVNISNTEEIKSNIQTLWDDKKMRKEIAQKGFDFVQKFNDDAIANELISVYNNLYYE